MSQLQPNDIESINVLKGESATAKYGEKGKNGVVEITMKKNVTGDDMKIKVMGDKVQLKTSNATIEANEITVTGYKSIKGQNASGTNPDQNEKPASVNLQAWRSFLEKKLKTVIAGAAAKGAKPGSYTVNIRFLVRTDGSVADFMALNKPGYDLEKHILAIMPQSPKWLPAEINGSPVNTYHTQPVTFVIAEQ